MNDRILNPVAVLLILGVLFLSGPTVRLLKKNRLNILDIVILFVLAAAAVAIFK